MITAGGTHNFFLRVAAGVILLAGLGVQAQTVQPAVIEIATGKQMSVDGHFEIVNNTLEPMIVTFEAKSFDIRRDGVGVFRPLSPDVRLDLSANSIRLWPRQHRTIFYRASAPHFPTWFCIYSNFSSAAHRGGVQIQLEMPHTVYLLDRTRASAAQVRFTDLHREGNVLHGVVQNTSGTLVRVSSLQVSGKHGSQEAGGFPLLPGADHEFAVVTEAGSLHVRAHTAGFHVDGEVQ